MSALIEVDVPRAAIARFRPLIGQDRFEELAAAAVTARDALDGITVWNISSTARGGGVAEMLYVLVGYARDAGIDTRWAVIVADAEFFAITKRVHNRLHGLPGDTGALGPAEQSHYRRVLAENAAALTELVRPGDVVVLHDPQTAGMAAALRAHGAHVIWRCHIGATTRDQYTEEAWAFLRPEIEPCQAFVFSVRSYVPAWLGGADVSVIAPSIDPFSPKNQSLDDVAMGRILGRLGIVLDHPDDEPATFSRRDGTLAHVSRSATVISEHATLSEHVPLVAQISRWDRLKDMQGVLEGFAARVADHVDAHLALVGPAVEGVSDDPEGAAVLGECIDAWRALPEPVRAKISLMVLPMEDLDENAVMVNALQRHSTIVTQKSLVEGFGITVTEAMWKTKPVVATAVGGIPDQLSLGAGVMLPDPTDLVAFGDTVADLLRRPDELEALGNNAHQRVLDGFVGDRHLIHFADLFTRIAANGHR